MAQSPGYSSLEVNKSKIASALEVNNAGIPSDLEVGRKPQSPREDYSTLQTNQPDLALFDTHKESTIPWQQPRSDYSVSASETAGSNVSEPTVTKPGDRTIFGQRRRTFWIVIAVVVVVIATIVGGVVGGVAASKGSTGSTMDSDPSGTASTATFPAVPSASRLLESTKLATVAWNDTDSVQQQRVYLQTTDDNIWELSWNSSGGKWFTSSEAVATTKAKSSTALTAAVSYENRDTVSSKLVSCCNSANGYSKQLNVYYINTAGELFQMNTTDFTTWDTNPVKTEEGAIAKPADDSSLAATWYRYAPCADCSENAFLAYQDSDNGSFQVVNTSRSGDVQYATVPGDPVSGSGSTFNTQWRSPVRANLRLGYQEQGGQIASSFWNGKSTMLCHAWR